MNGTIRVAGVVAASALLTTCLGTAAVAQDAESTAKKGEHAGASEGHYPGEVELLASGQFRSLFATYEYESRWGLVPELRVYNSRSNTVASLGFAYPFPLGEYGKYGKLIPGFSVLFGNIRTAPAFTLRYEIECNNWVAALGLVQSLIETNASDGSHHGEEESSDSNRFDNISDGNHISYRFGPALVGATWEHIQFRRESEWKYGARVAYKVRKDIDALGLVLVPDGVEVRLGVKWRFGAE